MKKKKAWFCAMQIVCALLTTALCGCGKNPERQETPSGTAATVTPTAADPLPESTAPEAVDPLTARLEAMTLEEKVGQLFLVRPDALDFSQSQAAIDDPNLPGVTGISDTLAEALESYPVGGIVLFGKNLISPDQCRDMIASWQAASRLPLLVAVDEEGGNVARLANAPGFNLPKYRNAASVGASGDPDDAEAMGRTIGSYLTELGFSLDFAPVADVNTNPRNPVIGTRAFSSDPQTAAGMVAGAVDGFHQAGIACCLKHFPGHGDTAQDSHFGTAVAEKTWDEMLCEEMLPFRAGIYAGAELVMVGHISTPNATDDDLPASLSAQWITRLRENLGFEGLIITDSLAMEAITRFYPADEAAVMVLSAGVDLLLMPEDLRSAWAGILDAVENGTLSEARIDESVLRVLKLKSKLGLI